MSNGAWRLEHWLRHIESVHFRSIDLTLDRVRRVAHVMKLPHSCRHIVVAGTNGKGSSVAYLESIYARAGYRVAAYTSPHLVRYNERVRIDGRPVADSLLEAAFAAVESARGRIPLTYFEFGTLAALWVIRERQPDVAILEVGMGGRLDAVNIVDSDVALITEIGLDHQQWLGDTVEKIAAEKAGVLRYRAAAVTSGRQIPKALVDIAAARRCYLARLFREFSWEKEADHWTWSAASGAPIDRLPLPFGGAHQLNNAAGAVAVVRLLEALLPVDVAAVREGIGRAVMPGRLHFVSEPAPMLLDVSHNPDGLSALAACLAERTQGGRCLAVFSMLADKDISGSVRRLAHLIDHWYVARLDNARAADAESLSAAIRVECDMPIVECVSIRDAATRALGDAGPDDLVVVFGSFYAVGDIMTFLGLDPYAVSRQSPPE